MELSSSEAWYDAEEDLAPAGAAGKAEEEGEGGAVQRRDECQMSFLAVTDLPSDVSEVMMPAL